MNTVEVKQKVCKTHCVYFPFAHNLRVFMHKSGQGRVLKLGSVTSTLMKTAKLCQQEAKLSQYLYIFLEKPVWLWALTTLNP